MDMLNDQQMRTYLSKLGFTEAPAPTKENLDKLIYAHQTNIPFSTIEIHRTQAAPDLEIENVYKRIIEDGKGGYCFELNKLFQALLESLDYDVRPVLCRAVRGRDGRMPINHRGILVRIDGSDYSADVGFGGPMPAGALKLDAGTEQEICGDTYIAVPSDDNSWWKLDRITKAHLDLHDDGLPARRQTELELCTAAVEDIDFEPLSIFCSQPGTLFRDHEVVNLRTDGGYKGYKDGVLTIRENGEKKTMKFENPVDQNTALNKYFNMSY